MKRLLFYALLAHSFAVLCYRWGQPLVGEHAFRQSQTAISCYWMSRGGQWLAYQTPVLGPPWQIPFEFPLYQWIVTVLASGGIGIDNAGRLVSWDFAMATMWPLWKVGTYFRVDPRGVCSLYLASPLYLFWSTAFLIDTTALFFSAMFLMLALEERWICAMVIGVLAALVKVPTLLPFAALLLVSPFARELRGPFTQTGSRLAVPSERC